MHFLISSYMYAWFGFMRFSSLRMHNSYLWGENHTSVTETCLLSPRHSLTNTRCICGGGVKRGLYIQPSASEQCRPDIICTPTSFFVCIKSNTKKSDQNVGHRAQFFFAFKVLVIKCGIRLNVLNRYGLKLCD